MRDTAGFPGEQSVLVAGGSNLLRELGLQLWLIVTYFLAGKLGLSLAYLHPSASPVWPPTAIALAAVLCVGYRVWPAIFIGALLVNITTSGNAWTSTSIACGNTLEAIVGAVLVNTFAHGRHAFDSASGVLRFALFAGLLGTAISATIGVSSLSLGGFAPPERFGSIWLTWWLGDVSSALVLAPLLLTWIGRRLPELNARRAIEAGAMLLATVLVGMVVFAGWFPSNVKNYPVGYVGLLPLLWAAFRFGRRGAATSAAIMSTITIWGSLHGYGPFRWPDANISLVLLAAFLATITLTALILAAVVLESRRTLAQLSRTGEEARAANRAKDDFLAVLSHELRTPLTPVLASLSLLQTDPDVSPQHRAELEMLRRNVELETRLIDDLLDISRITHGKLQMTLQPMDLHRVIDHALEICRPDARPGHELKIVKELRADEHNILGDAARVEQVFRNLLSNASKFMPGGGNITVRSDNPQAGTIRIEVIDTGVGISPELLARLFRPFEQGDASGCRSDGLGLGLTISRNIVNALGGTLQARSAGLNQGATFIVQLPTTDITARPGLETDPAAPVASSAASENGKLRILLVEDHADSARVLARVLRHNGHEVHVAGSVQSAMELATSTRFDLVISDVGLPDGSGLELMRDLKARFDLRGIALSGYGMDHDIRLSHEAGFAEHLTKPVDAERLQAAIQELTSKDA